MLRPPPGAANAAKATENIQKNNSKNIPRGGETPGMGERGRDAPGVTGMGGMGGSTTQNPPFPWVLLLIPDFFLYFFPNF